MHTNRQRKRVNESRESFYDHSGFIPGEKTNKTQSVALACVVMVTLICAHDCQRHLIYKPHQQKIIIIEIIIITPHLSAAGSGRSDR